MPQSLAPITPKTNKRVARSKKSPEYIHLAKTEFFCFENTIQDRSNSVAIIEKLLIFAAILRIVHLIYFFIHFLRLCQPPI